MGDLESPKSFRTAYKCLVISLSLSENLAEAAKGIIKQTNKFYISWNKLGSFYRPYSSHTFNTHLQTSVATNTLSSSRVSRLYFAGLLLYQ